MSRQLEPALWELTRNPWDVLQAGSRSQIERVLADHTLCRKVDALVQSKKHVVTAPMWCQQSHPQTLLTGVAYASMEFVLQESVHF